jgi:hypothetical protein
MFYRIPAVEKPSVKVALKKLAPVRMTVHIADEHTFFKQLTSAVQNSITLAHELMMRLSRSTNCCKTWLKNVQITG